MVGGKDGRGKRGYREKSKRNMIVVLKEEARW